MPRVGLNRGALVAAAIQSIDDGQPATLAQLTLAGYSHVSQVVSPGEYAVRRSFLIVLGLIVLWHSLD